MGVVKLVLLKIQKVIASHMHVGHKSGRIEGPLILAYYNEISYQRVGINN